MQKLSTLIADNSALFHRLQGDCEKHGAVEVLKFKTNPDWHCPKCFEEAIVEKDRAAHTEARRVLMHTIARIPAKYKDQRFTAHTPAQRDVRGMARNFRDFILDGQHWSALILTGEAGTGKTLLACEIGQAMIDRLMRGVRYTTAAGMIGEIRAAYGLDGKTEEGEIERFAGYHLLIIDEIDAMRGTVNDQMLLTEVINRRYSNERPVIVITNQRRESLAQYVGDRVDDRLHENAFVCSFDWPSFRRNPVDSERLSA
jgi:DNA replication protein DnaC